MRPKLRTSDSKGFTLLELLIVVAILGILATFAITAYQIYVKKAKSVEGEMALADIKRLEESYYADHGQFSDSLSTIGFNPTAPLKYYTITIQLDGAGPPPFLYQATATADLDGDPDLDAWVYTLYPDGTSDLRHGCIHDGVGPVDFTCTD